MRLRVVVMAMLVIAAGCVVGASTARSARAASGVTVRVVRCPTLFGSTPGRSSVPRALVLRGVPSSTAKLIAYTNTHGYLIGPPHLQCAGVVGADGNATIQAWPVGQAKPGRNGAGAGLALSVISTCVSCKAQATCHYFPTFDRSTQRTQLNCRPEPPPGERLRYLAKRLVAFVDGPFIKGAGWPSGAGLTSTGLVGIRPGANQVVFTSSCTLPTAQQDVCVDSAAAARSLYGRLR
jgi:hypothetical protein